jgi:hypothetical protein
MTRMDFWVKLLGKLALPATDWRIAVFEFWAQQENMPYDRTFNPLATTRISPAIALNTSYDIGFGPGNWNHVPVRVYATENDGVQATFETIQLSYYENIRKMLLEQKPNLGIIGPNDFTSWVGPDNPYGQRVYDYALSLPPPSVTIPATVFSAEQRAEVMKMIEFFVSSSFPAYWEALWNGGFTKYPVPLKPWIDGSQNKADILAKELQAAIDKYLKG